MSEKYCLKFKQALQFLLILKNFILKNILKKLKKINYIKKVLGYLKKYLELSEK